MCNNAKDLRWSNTFYTEIDKKSENRKSGSKPQQENEINKMKQKIILIKILVETNFWSPILSLSSPLEHKIVKIQCVLSTPLSSRLRKPKPRTYIYWLQNHPMDHLTSPIDRSQSQLSVTFFPGSVRFLNRSKRSILFFIFWPFFLDHLKSWSIIYRCCYYKFVFIFFWFIVF